MVVLQFLCGGHIPDVRVARVVLPDGSALNAVPGYGWTVETCFLGPGYQLEESPVQNQLT
jgi:hypothetical protein